MKERPILFNGEMVRAILEGRKTQTRRVIREQPHRFMIRAYQYITSVLWSFSDKAEGESWPQTNDRKCPYGVPGDRLWVRETWGYWEREEDVLDHFKYFADDAVEPLPERDHPSLDHCVGRFNRKIPSIHMPRWASRINLEVTAVRVERLQDITERDAFAEGIQFFEKDCTTRAMAEHLLEHSNVEPKNPITYKFKKLWESINAKRGFGWDVNPWVWVVEFKRVEQPGQIRRPGATKKEG